MNPDMTQLAEILVKTISWQWMNGMIDTHGRRITRVCHGMPCEWVHGFQRQPWTGALPNLNDPATLGCLRSMVEQDTHEIVHHSDNWFRLEKITNADVIPSKPVMVFKDRRYIGGSTLVEALVDAMMYAPHLRGPL